MAEEQNSSQLADKVVSDINKDFKVLGGHRVHSWYAWAIVGIVFGMALGMVYVANQGAQFSASQAAQSASNIKNFYIGLYSSSGNNRTTEYVIVDFAQNPGNLPDIVALQIAKPSAKYKRPVVDKKYKDYKSSATSFMTIADKQTGKQIVSKNIAAGTEVKFSSAFNLTGGVLTGLTNADVYFTSGEAVTVFVNGNQIGEVFPRTKGIADTTRTISIPTSAFQEGLNTVEYRLKREEKSDREFVLSATFAFTTVNASGDSIRDNIFTNPVSVIGTSVPSNLNEWYRAQSKLGLPIRDKEYDVEKRGQRLLKRLYLTSGIKPLSISSIVVKNDGLKVRRAAFTLGGTFDATYATGLPGIGVLREPETDPRLSQIAFNQVALKIINPLTGASEQFGGTFGLKTGDTNNLVFTGAYTVPAQTSVILEFYSEPISAFAASDVISEFRQVLLANLGSLSNIIALEGDASVDLVAGRRKPIEPVILDLSATLFPPGGKKQAITMSIDPISPSLHFRTPSSARAPVLGFKIGYGIEGNPATVKKLVFSYTLDAQPGAPRLENFMYQGRPGVINEIDATHGEVSIDLTPEPLVYSAYDPHYFTLAAVAVAGTTPKAKAVYTFAVEEQKIEYRLNPVFGGADFDLGDLTATVYEPFPELTKDKTVTVTNP